MLIRTVIVLVAAVVVGIVLGLVSTAHAEPDRARASRHFDRGISFYELGKYEEAIKEFEAAYVLYAADSLLFNLAQAHRKLDRCADALRYYERFLARRPDSPQAKQVVALLPPLRRACEVKFTKPTGVTPAEGLSNSPPESAIAVSAPAGPVAEPRETSQVAVSTQAAAMTAQVERVEPARVRLYVASTASGLVSPAGRTTALGATASIGVMTRGIPFEIGVTGSIASYTWSSHGLDARSGLATALAAARFTHEVGATELLSELGAGLLVLSHMQPGNPLRERGSDVDDALTLAPAAHGVLTGRRELGGGWSVRGGATVLLAPVANAGGLVGELRLLAGLELAL